jgi:hypothetical protein
MGAGGCKASHKSHYLMLSFDERGEGTHLQTKHSECVHICLKRTFRALKTEFLWMMQLGCHSADTWVARGCHRCCDNVHERCKSIIR